MTPPISHNNNKNSTLFINRERRTHMKKDTKCKKTNQAIDKKQKKHPEFKPGDKSYTQYGNEFLNKDVHWSEVVMELLQIGETKKHIAEYAECSESTISNILKQQYEQLTFRAGARIITLHYNQCPAHYCC
jgi:DNA-binding NarL/FixJ family response regulator